MREFLLGRLYGPLCSWGEVVAGELRSTQDHPTRSAVLGLIGAALGLEREDHHGHRMLSESLWLGVVVHAPGDHLEDYHTVETPHGSGGRGMATRSEELAYKRRNTILSRRGYLCDQASTFGLWCKDGAKEGILKGIRDALKKPHWTLYLGRKSCPLALPIEGHVVEAPTFLEAIGQARFRANLDEWGIKTLERPQAYWDAEAPGVGLEPRVHSRRRDEPRDRVRWQYDLRHEAQCRWPMPLVSTPPNQE